MQERPRSQTKQNQISLPIRIIFTGNAGVGKTSIINAFFKNYMETFKTLQTDTYSVTQEYVKQILKNKQSKIPFTKYSVKLIDASGDKKLRNFVQKFYCRGNSFIFVSAVNDKVSLDDYDNWLTNVNIQKHVPVFLIGNKIDLQESEHQFGQADLQKKHQQIGRFGQVFMTSAIDESYHLTVRNSINQVIYQTIEQTYEYQKARKSSIYLEKYHQNWEGKKKKCCK